jgi:hypothetical protein
MMTSRSLSRFLRKKQSRKAGLAARLFIINAIGRLCSAGTAIHADPCTVQAKNRKMDMI